MTTEPTPKFVWVHHGWEFFNRTPNLYWDAWGVGVGFGVDTETAWGQVWLGPIQWNPTLSFPGKWRKFTDDSGE